MRYTIKPLDENHKVVKLRVTQIEGALHPCEFKQEDKFLRDLTMLYGTICHDIFLTACRFGKDMAQDIQDTYIPEINNILSDIESKYEKSPSIYEYFHYLRRVTIPQNQLIELGLQYPAEEVETTQFCEFECGKYLVQVSGTIDHISESGLLDLKSCSQLREKPMLDEYHKDNIEFTSIGSHIQRYWYPIMKYGDKLSTYKFTYLPFVKEKTKKKEKPLDFQELKCIIDTNRAIEKMKKDIIFYFKYCFKENEYFQAVSNKGEVENVGGDE